MSVPLVGAPSCEKWLKKEKFSWISFEKFWSEGEERKKMLSVKFWYFTKKCFWDRDSCLHTFGRHVVEHGKNWSWKVEIAIAEEN